MEKYGKSGKLNYKFQAWKSMEKGMFFRFFWKKYGKREFCLEKHGKTKNMANYTEDPIQIIKKKEAVLLFF